MLHRYIILTIVIVVTYFSIWAAECNLGCRPGRYEIHDDTLGAIRLPSCGTIGGSNSMRYFGNESTGILKRKNSFGHVSGSSVGPVSGPNAGAISGPSAGPVSGPNAGAISGPSAGPVSGPSAGPSTDPVIDPTTDGGGLVLPIYKPGKRDRCACEACPCAMIEEYLVPVTRVGMRSANAASDCLTEVTDRILLYFGILLSYSRNSGRRNAQIIRSGATLYGESNEEFRLVNNPNFDRNVSRNPSVNFGLLPAVTSTTHYVKELAQQITVKVSELSFPLLNKTSDPSVKKTEATCELSDKNTKLTIQEHANASNNEGTSEIKVKQTSSEIDLLAKKSGASRDLFAQKTEKLSDKIVNEAETIKRTDKKIENSSDQCVNETCTAFNPPDKNIHMSATSSKDHTILKSPTKDESTESVRVHEIEETIDPELNCSKCVEEEHLCPVECAAKLLLFLCLSTIILYIPLGRFTYCDPSCTKSKVLIWDDNTSAMCCLCDVYKTMLHIGRVFTEMIDKSLTFLLNALYEAKLQFYRFLGSMDNYDLCRSVCCDDVNGCRCPKYSPCKYKM